MSLGLHERRMRRRRGRWAAVIKWLFVFGFFVGLGAYAYYAGSNLAQHEVTVQKEKVATLETEVETLQQTKAKLERQLQMASSKVLEWEEAYRRDVPDGELKTFLDKVSTKLAGGISNERLSFVIDNAAEPRDCDAEPVAKRFIVRTPLHKGANDAVTFDNKRITVTAEGESAVNDQGQPEAWFDTDKELSLTFTLLTGEQSVAKSVLPLHHGIIQGDSEYRFTAEPGARGFITVSGIRCGYP